MSTITRRSLMAGAALSPAVALPADPRRDSLLEAINAFRAALDDFCRNAPEDDVGSDIYAKASFEPAKRVLDNWDRPATTKRGAIEALRLASEELDAFERSEMMQPLVNAALAYFEGGAA